MAKGIKVDFVFIGREFALFKKGKVVNLANDVKKSYIGPDLSLELVFDYSGRVVRELNKRYRNKDYDTDVLSFAGEDNENSQIFISIRYLVSNGLVLSDLLEIIKHGILHVLGFDHESNEELVEMEEAKSNFFVGL